MRCMMCGHKNDIQKCGFGMVNEQYLCHADDHDCYHLWTVWGERPVPGIQYDPYTRGIGRGLRVTNLNP